MKYATVIVFIMFSLVAISSCGDRANESISGVNITLTPRDGSDSNGVSVEVTATFSNNITTPSSWANYFTLLKNNSGSSLCTDWTFDTNSLVATCVHDDLDPGTSYTASVLGLRDSNNMQMVANSSTFTTAQ